ncbi:hypothetical protein VFPPC_15822 [Pochonia chlamydosporia 170]|uniref:Uncharacterized protein n=1 Tax=Pochonia chlamydosporia 170 TaxID=1380566 RepID=A0A179FTH5_METCM|nr:hypothetical protein VFPPC_15822 [Pochonia chlamydosporia 170]OAQ68393.1 hypothetical protein VFPPC_15822 [Pochonia chlamydosporia 170]
MPKRDGSKSSPILAVDSDGAVIGHGPRMIRLSVWFVLCSIGRDPRSSRFVNFASEFNTSA